MQMLNWENLLPMGIQYFLCLLFRGEAAILIVFGEISYGKHKKLSHPFLGVGFSATEKAIRSIHMPGLPTQKQEFGSRHRDSLRCCHTHAFLPSGTSPTRQLVWALRQQD
jgi:hypothetical protein